MAEPFSFLDRIDQLVGEPAGIVTEARETLMRAGSWADDHPELVRVAVFAALLEAVNRRLREPLAQALYEHFETVKAEFEMLEGECPDTATAKTAWHVTLKVQIAEELMLSEVGQLLGNAGVIKDVLGDTCSADRVADAVLAVPVVDPMPVLTRIGVTDAAVGALVTELLEPEPVAVAAPDALAGLVLLVGAHLDCGGDAAIASEAVGYLLCEDDELLRATGLDLLELEGDDRAAVESFCEVRDYSDPALCAADAAEVVRRATEKGGDASEIRSNNTAPETAAGASEGAAPAATVRTFETGTARCRRALRVDASRRRGARGALRPRLRDRQGHGREARDDQGDDQPVATREDAVGASASTS